MIRIISDELECAGSEKQLQYDLMVGRETLDKLKAVFDFKKSTIDIDSVVLPMQSLSVKQDPRMLWTHTKNLKRREYKISDKTYSLHP